MVLRLIQIMFLFLLASCANEEFLINAQKGPSHRLVQNTNIYIRPIEGYLTARDFNGFQDRLWSWSISFKYSENSLQQIEETYSKKNIEKKGNEFVKIKNVKYKDTYSGVLIKYKDIKRNMLRWYMAIDRGTNRLIVKSFISMEYLSKYERAMEYALQSVIFESEENILDSDKNPYKLDESVYEFAGIQDNKYVYTRDGELSTKSEDGAMFMVHNFKSNIRVANVKDQIFSEMLADNYEIKYDGIIDSTAMRKSEEWYATNDNGNRFGYGGYIWKYEEWSRVFVFQAVCNSDFEENLKSFKRIARSIPGRK